MLTELGPEWATLSQTANWWAELSCKKGMWYARVLNDAAPPEGGEARRRRDVDDPRTIRRACALASCAEERAAAAQRGARKPRSG